MIHMMMILPSQPRILMQRVVQQIMVDWSSTYKAHISYLLQEAMSIWA